MITIRPSQLRGHADHGWLNARHSFSFGNYYDPNNMGFRTLRVLNEDHIEGGAGFPTHPHADMEIITYIIDGSLVHTDSTGSRATLGVGDVQVMSAGRGIRHSEVNASKTEELHLIQIWIEPAERGTEPRHAEVRFEDHLKRNRLQAIASDDERDGSLPIGQDAAVYVSVLDPGETINYALETGRYGWVQLIRGELLVNGKTLTAGDAADIRDLTNLAFEAVQEAEFLFFDLA